MHISALQDLVSSCVAYKRLCERVVEADATDNHSMMLALSIRSRQFRHNMIRAGAGCSNTAPQIDNIEEIMGAIHKAQEDFAEGDQILRQRAASLARLKNPRQVAATQETAMLYVDHRLPASWSFTEDLILIIGDGMVHVEAALKGAGHERIIRVRADEIEFVYKQIRAMKPRGPGEILMITDENNVSDHVKQRIQDACRDSQIFTNTLNTFWTRWIKNGVQNLPLIGKISPIYAAGGSFANRPAILVAPGPSLDENISALKQFEGKALIVTMSHALKALDSAGIKPDFVVTVDSANLLYHFDGCNMENVAALATGITCDPAIFKLKGPRHFFVGANASADSWMLSDVCQSAMLSSGGSVATTAMSMVIALGCNPIVAVGLDLAYDGEKYYSEGIHDAGIRVVSKDGSMALDGWSDPCKKAIETSNKSVEKVQQICELPGYDGGTVQTSTILKMFHSWFEASADGLNGSRWLVNATEGGASINGWDQMPLQKFFDEHIAELPTFDSRELINRAVKADRPQDRRAAVRQKLAIMRTGIPHVKRLIARGTKAIVNGDMDAIYQIESDLLSALGRVNFISLCCQSFLHTALDRSQSLLTTRDALLTERELLHVLEQVLGDIAPLVVGNKNSKKRKRRR